MPDRAWSVFRAVASLIQEAEKNADRRVWRAPIYALPEHRKKEERIWRTERTQEREDDIWTRRQSGETFLALGERWNISTERARQIYKKRYSDENYRDA